MFVVHPQLEADSLEVGFLGLSQIRLMNDARYPWFILVPQREDVQEMIDLTLADQEHLLQEIRWMSQMIKDIWRPDKLNIAMLGNRVPQLHIHIIGRFKHDVTWPKTVWNEGSSQKYLASEAKTLIMRVQQYIKQNIES